MVDTVQPLLFQEAEKSQGKSWVSERRHPPALNVPDSGTTAALWEGKHRKRGRGDLLGSWVAMSHVQKEQLALSGFALPTLWQQKQEKELDKNIWEQPKSAKIGLLPLQRQSTALSSVPVLLSHHHHRKHSKIRVHWSFPDWCKIHFPSQKGQTVSTLPW